MTEEQIKWLQENIEIDVKVEEHYTYCGSDSEMYTSYKTIILKVAGKVIQEVSFT